MKSNIIEILVVIIITAASTFFITKNSIKPEKVLLPGKADTLTVEKIIYKDKPVYVKLPGEIDTVYHYINDGNDSTMSVIASADTIIQKDSSSIQVKYFFPPENFFDIKMDLKEKIITLDREVTKYIELKPPWYDRFWVGIAAVLAVISTIILL